MAFLGARRRWLTLVTLVMLFIIFGNLFFFKGEEIKKKIDQVPLPSLPGKGDETAEKAGFEPIYKPRDNHPISLLMAEADKKWKAYEDQRSKTFKQTVKKYRRKYGRHPPPGFDAWYKFARERNVHNIDDFEQVMDDLRPFWAIQPRRLRRLAAHLWEKKEDGISGIHIRDHKVAKLTNKGWRSETLASLIEKFIEYLPDMDIAMNRLDQPRMVVPWDDMQALLSKELETRRTLPEVINEFSGNTTDLLDVTIEKPEDDKSEREDPEWYNAPGKQYMDIAKTACPPESHAVVKGDMTTAEESWKDRTGGIVKNFNSSTDLCTIGPEIQDKHGFLYSSSSIVATKRLVPVFGECKVNVNSDILFPANMYWTHDVRYDYDDKFDVKWEEKKEEIIWRGVTSGGVQLKDNWERMHRQRLVRLLNATVMQDQQVRVLTEQPDAQGQFENFRTFQPSLLLEQISDVGFTEGMSCIPNCDFYNDVWTYKDQVDLAEQFKSKFLVDVDGHSFSGRWRAFLESKALGIKATIFREWHDSRLFAWRHFVPMDNRYDEIFTVMTYFLGTGKRDERSPSEAFVARHDLEAKRLALQGREWAKKVLRRDDIEVSYSAAETNENDIDDS